jgi:Uma2 family endonuclease
MDRRRCRTYQGGMRVQLSEDFGAGNSYRPDVLVRCGQTGEQRGGKTYVTDPIVIVEVLSPSTIDHDRGRKLRFYKEMPTVRHIILAYSDQMRVEHHTRTTEGWRRNVLTAPEQALVLDAVAFTIGLGQIYFDPRF